MNQALNYPPTERGTQVDNYHGQQVADPWRWLEEPDSPATRAWIEAQNALTQAFLAKIPEREKLRTRLTELWNHERFGLPRKVQSQYFYSRNDGLQNQSVLLVADSLDGTPRVLLDPNTMSEDGTVSLVGTAISDNAKYIAYGLAKGGSDWNEWYVRDVETGKDTEDHLKWIKFSGASWTNDNAGFYYSRFNEPAPGAALTEANYYKKLYYHKLGEDQSQDRLVYDRKDEKEWSFSPVVTEDGCYLVIYVSKGTKRENQIFLQDLQTPDAPVTELISGFDASYGFLGNDGTKFYFQTDNRAPLGRVIALDITKPEQANWTELVPESKMPLESVSLVGDQFFAVYLKDAASQVRTFALDGTPTGEIALPGIGSAGGFGGRRDQTETFYAFSSYTSPTTLYRYDIPTKESTVFRKPKVPFESDQYETKQLFATSKDGTRVPIFVSHKKGLKLDGNNPTLLYAYGGFGISLTPGFDTRSAVWMEQGGVYAVANLRGGAEYGVPWHEAGQKLSKQNVFDDFIAAAEHLIAEKYTSSNRLGIAGRSNGGLLVGAVMTQRPELFGAALPGVGVMDMLRFHKFTIGWAWVSEYGIADNPEEFAALLKYSPLHNIRPGTAYPATFIVTADHDDRVVPAHSFKFAAELQAAQGGPAPILIRIETKAGHGMGMALSKKIDETTDELSFLWNAIGL
ncbi:MAG: prolyl oligopeptidase family serine peptidase [Planctomycetota bacterium]|nr:prolyl oligopeptidase family serine peptidase [Planctomycetota bacterium]